MSVNKSLVAALVAGLWCASSAQADAGRRCSAAISRSDVVPCALAASARLRAEREADLALKGRARAASAVLPSNPTLALSAARRSTTGADATNWYGTLSQEIELGGQRRARQRAVASERAAQASAIASVEREVAAEALRAYFELLGARDALRLAEHLEQTFEGAASAARAAAESGLSAGIDADLAEFSGVRLTQARLAAQQRFRAATALLASLLGLDPVAAPLQAEGELTPLPLVDALTPELARTGSAQRPELTAAAATRAAYEGWSDVYRRARVPNLTLSAFAQRDGFDERVLGGGLSLPITLPAGLARDSSGEAAENAALARRAGALLEQTEREVRLEMLEVVQALETARAEQALYTEARVARAEQSLDAIAREIAAGRLAVTSMSGSRAS